MFFAFVIDVFSRMIVGWQFATHMRRTLVFDALRMALGLRAPGADAWLAHHSDRVVIIDDPATAMDIIANETVEALRGRRH